MDRPRQRQKDKKSILTEEKPFQTETDQETKSLGKESIASKSKRAETHWRISGCILHISLFEGPNNQINDTFYWLKKH